MPLETAQYIDSLNPSNPTGDDPVAQADDHLRMIKQVLQATFPNIKAPVTLDAPTLNGYTVPKGLISLWSGAITAIPAGWFLCDGTNGTPNLKDRFVVGAGATYAVGATGGAVTAGTTAAGAHGHSTDAQGSHSHSGATQSHVLSIDEMPAHHHQSPWGESSTDAPFGIDDLGTRGYGSGQTDTDNFHWNTSTTGGNQGHFHGIGLDGYHAHNVSSVGDHTHSVDTRSPYYALAYIMKG